MGLCAPANRGSICKGLLDEKLPGMKPWVIHDLRRTFATFLAETEKDGGLGVAPQVIEMLLNHVSGSKSGVAGIYNRAKHMAERRDVLNRWADFIQRLVTPPPLKLVKACA